MERSVIRGKPHKIARLFPDYATEDGRSIRATSLPRAARRMIDLEPGGAFELVLGQAIFVRIDCVLARLVITARLNTNDLVVGFELADLLDENVINRPFAFRLRRVRTRGS